MTLGINPIYAGLERSCPRHRRNEERAQGVPWAPPIRSKKGPIRSKIGGERTKMGPFLGVVFHKIPLVIPSLDQKEQNCFRHPQFYGSIAPMSGWLLYLNVQSKLNCHVHYDSVHALSYAFNLILKCVSAS